MKVCRREGRQRWRGEAGNLGLEAGDRLHLAPSGVDLVLLAPSPPPPRFLPVPQPRAFPEVAVAASPPFQCSHRAGTQQQQQRQPSFRGIPPSAGSLRGSHSSFQRWGVENGKDLQSQGWEMAFLVPPASGAVQGIPKSPKWCWRRGWFSHLVNLEMGEG
jgi:hypothetical protein